MACPITQATIKRTKKKKPHAQDKNVRFASAMQGGHKELECEPIPNVMAALPNIGGALCSTPQSLADVIECRAVTLPRRETC